MRLLSAALSATLSALLLSSTVAIAQTGFTQQTYPASPGDTKVLTADFNQDGHPDILVYGSSGNAFHIYLNNGSGGFTAPTVTAATYGDIAIAKVVDLNEDGFPDVITCTVSGNVIGYINDRNGHFRPTLEGFIAGQKCVSLVVGDVNLDGQPDVVIGSVSTGPPTPASNGLPSYQNFLQTFFQNGSASLSQPVTLSNLNFDTPATYGDTNCAIADITGGNFYLDNQFSLFVTSNCYSFNPPEQFGTIFLGHSDGTGQFTFTASSSNLQYLNLPRTVDLNLDGRPDVVFASSLAYNNYTGLESAINNGGGSFTYNEIANTNNIDPSKNPGGGFGIYGIATGDFNGDGNPDIATSLDGAADLQGSTQPGPSLINIYTGSQSGTFTNSQTISIGNANTAVSGLAAADFNNDSTSDLATLVIDESGSAPYPTQLYVYSSSQGCTAPATANSNILCTPASGKTVTAPVEVTAASNVAGLTLNRLYLDNQNVYQTTSATVNTSLTAATGYHRLVLVSYNNKGQAFTSTSTFTVGSGGPSGCTQSVAGANICSPSAGATASSPVTISAGVMAYAGNITAIRAYIDGTAVFTVNNPTTSYQQQVSQSVTVAPGSHNLVIIGYQNNGYAVKASENFTVSGSTPCYPSSAGASICSPANSSTTSSPFNLTAGATAGSGYITAIRVYVDNVAKTLINNPQKSKSFAINPSITAAAGKHSIVVVGYQSTGGSVTATSYITVQ